jgi:hypothetical protein
LRAIVIASSAAIPSAGARRPSAVITPAEKAKKKPAITPQPSAAIRARMKGGLLIGCLLRD